VVLGALLAPASAHAQKPCFDIRRAEAPSLHATRPLTGPAARTDRVAHALTFARGHARALGLTAARIAALGTPERSTVSGIERLSWQRSFGDIPAFGDELRVALAPDGAVLSASGTSVTAAPSSLTPSLSAAQAMAVVSDDAGASAAPRVVAGPRGVRRTTTFTGGARAQLIVFGSRLAWEVAYPALPAAFYDTLVDATTGAILRRVNLVKSAAPADVWDDHPQDPTVLPPTHVDLEGFGPLRAGTTLQNDWMRVFSDENGNDTLDAGEGVAPPAGTAYAFHEFAGTGCTDVKPCAWNPVTADWTDNREQVAVQAFYLANQFRKYLAAPPIGFDGFGNTVEPLDIETDYGADRAGDPDSAPGYYFNNSAMVLGIDRNGNDVGPWAMELSLFGARFTDGSHGFRAMDAGDDASIVDHEYTHGYTNQTVTFSDRAPALFTWQAYAIDEASADFFAKSYLVDKHFEPDTDAPGEVDMGDYTDVTPHSIRFEPLDCPVGTTAPACPAHGYTYADFARIFDPSSQQPDPEPHADGEIWSETMWDLRRALSPAKATQLAAQALAIVAPEPSFLDMRNAILAADATDGYDDAATIWQVFARRGMGCDASTTSGDDVQPVAGFNVPPCPVATPTPTAIPTVSPTATPVATPTPPPPPKRPSFTLRRSGRRGVKFTVTCHAACSVTGRLSVSRSVAKRLHLGSRRTVGTVKARLNAAGHRTFAVRLNRTAARALKRAKKVKSFRATLTARAGYAGAAARSQHRTVILKR
jgi:extracellular elastinolytic metalloproteinase